MNRKILINGINGFVGKHLARKLSRRGCIVYGLGNASNQPDDSIAQLISNYIKCDLTDQDQVKSLNLEKIDVVINLAGLANVGESFRNPDLYMNVNTSVISILANELYKQNRSARLIAVSSGAVYSPTQAMPLTEQSKCHNSPSPYAASKIAMEKIAARLNIKGFDSVIVRPFNHIGPGQGLGFLIPDLIQRIQSLQPGQSLTTGDLSTSRDFSDVRDIACAYADIALCESLKSPVYNVCSGSALSGQKILEIICEKLNVRLENIDVKVDDSLIRPNDPKIIIGDSRRIAKELGWSTKIPIDQTISDILNNKRD